VLSERLQVGQLDDAKVIDRAAALIANGQLMLHWQLSRLRAPKVRDEPKEERAPDRSKAAPRKRVEDAAGFPGGHDMDGQSAALANASKSGTPFCEECEKARHSA
jgi:hypothetical protein